MWIEGNYRRNLMDMHIDDWNEDFLSKINVAEYVEVLKEAHVQAAMVKGRPHTGLAYFPTKIGRMHKGLKEYDFFGDMVKTCHENGIAVIAYFSQIFDNWAYDNHPEWRLVTPDGMTMREYRGKSDFKNGRYGIVCPNNEEYRAYVKACLTEMVENYDFEGIFLDMTFFPDICHCKSCREKYFAKTGREIPTVMDWTDPSWREYAHTLDEWMSEFAAFSTGCVKAVKPEVTVEHQFSRITCTWVDGSSEDLTNSVDYSGGDYYGGLLQQSFINKYYKSVSPNLPFVYHTSRCDPELVYHTTTKTEEELFLHVITALVHNGAFLLVDAINPDGSIVPMVYRNLMKNVYEKSMVYEQYVSGKLYADAAIWLASHAKYDPYENGVMVSKRTVWSRYYMEGPIASAKVLRENNIPYDVIASKNIKDLSSPVLILSHVAEINEREMDDIEAYIARGGNLLISGPIGNERLQKLLGVKVIGRTEHNFTYMSPTAAGAEIFEGFDRLAPLTIDGHQVEIAIEDANNLTVLATQTLPYTMTNTYEFAAIHSNPPGVYTDKPCAILKKVGDSTLIWTAAPIEMSRPYMSRQVYRRMVNLLAGEPTMVSNAPKYVEVLMWNKNEADYVAIINEQEESPIVPVYDITIELKLTGVKAYSMPDNIEMPVVEKDGKTTIVIPKLEVFKMIKLEKINE